MAFKWYLGVDWGSEIHAWCLVDAHGTRPASSGWWRMRRRRSPTALTHAADARPPRRSSDLAVGIEVGHGVARSIRCWSRACRCSRSIRSSWIDFAIALPPAARRTIAATRARSPTRYAPTRAPFARFTLTDPAAPRRYVSSRACSRSCRSSRRAWSIALREQLYRVDAPWLRLSPAANDPWLVDPAPGHAASRRLAATLAPPRRGRAPRASSHSSRDDRMPSCETLRTPRLQRRRRRQ